MILKNSSIMKIMFAIATIVACIIVATYLFTDGVWRKESMPISKQETEQASPKSVSLPTADNVTIFNNGFGISHGAIEYSLKNGKSQPSGPVIVYLWRNATPKEQLGMKKEGIRIGCAYLVTEKDGHNKYEFVREIDLTLSDEKIYAMFGVK
ncbi:hypothetical protein Cpha266_2117 [Chlorobium phaeobacteroides DSM 266]|jgi:hypothetical protein|uniref:Uncharacterized protein n=2 Tax=Chlorobium phaeobacteroides TaxID=1096 RepID=A1BIA2_CHLPD|nr:hypothetical protein Cpha266_2117 [Chlorobium phaeobacteroides DSM 266]